MHRLDLKLLKGLIIRISAAGNVMTVNLKIISDSRIRSIKDLDIECLAILTSMKVA